MYGESDVQLLTAIGDWVAQRRDELQERGFTIERGGRTDAPWEGNNTIMLDVKHPRGEGTLVCWAKGDCDTEVWLYSADKVDLKWTEINCVDDVVATVEAFFATFTELPSAS